MVETSWFFDMVPENTMVQKVQESVTIWTSSSEKRHVTVALTVATDGFIRCKTNQTIKIIEASESFVIGIKE